MCEFGGGWMVQGLTREWCCRVNAKRWHYTLYCPRVYLNLSSCTQRGVLLNVNKYKFNPGRELLNFNFRANLILGHENHKLILHG